ncbi:eukaryotic translation initiation factor 2-alpha kinase 1-like [Frankliniella occidentalis]|uniref:non-specific serine/threonine protein kinase n=1 Tax=Frankliniella occidentalis TaxID=133901 RepID=A0A6J1SVX9_FRAOC|nr:eukaryotic translation initiation factor 2-alpha kinase 1-like [Frankliniella occidentalis]
MEQSENAHSYESQSSQSSEELQDFFRPHLNSHDCSRSDANAWVNFKTITTFNSGISSSTDICGTSYSENHASHSPNLTKVEVTTQDKKIQESKSSCSMDIDEHFHFKHSHSSQFVEKSIQQNNSLLSSKEEILKSCINRSRRKSHRNSLSEGSNPYGVECESGKPRNGTMSDAGNNLASTSLRSCAPGPVQSLTRFSPTSLLVESLIDQLCKLMEKDSGKQKKLYHVICERLHQMQLIDDTYTIEEFQFMRSHYQKALYQLLAVAKSSTQSCDSKTILLPLPSSNMNFDIKVHSEQLLEWSRYQHEYQELEYIAKGGFGHVYKVRNKLDGGEYAIKKIFLRYRYVQGFLRSLKEVKMLARLNHPNIVSYKAAWLEPLDDEKYKAEIQKPSQSSLSQEISVSIVSVTKKSKLPLPPAPTDMTEDSLDIVFEDSSVKAGNNSKLDTPESQEEPSIVFKDFKLSDESESKTRPLSHSPGAAVSSRSRSGTDSSQCSNSDETDEGSSSSDDAFVYTLPLKAKRSRRNSSTSILKNWATLYVQMQLCERNLRQWLDLRNVSLPAYPLAPNNSNGILALSLFKKIVRGVDYIHTQGIVHHDIKPSNIFVNENLKEVQVGDFGLSCCILSRVDSTGAFGENHGEVGTRMYAAPEQLRGKCTSKSDLYSLGIVLLELLQPFHTDMERMKVIQELRTGHLPPELTTTWPHAARLISDLLVTSPASRPTANELLQRVDVLIRSNTESDFVSQMASKDETIRLLKEAVASRDQEITELRRRLSSFEKD